MREAVKHGKGEWDFFRGWYQKGDLSAADYEFIHDGQRIVVTYGFTADETRGVTDYDYSKLPYDDAHIVAFRFADKEGRATYTEELR